MRVDQDAVRRDASDVVGHGGGDDGVVVADPPTIEIGHIGPGVRRWVTVGLSALTALHVSGVMGEWVFSVGVLSAAAICVVGVRTYRPRAVWPWRFAVAAGILWTVAGVVRTATDATGDLSGSRSLLPDLFALPGYVAFGIMLVGLIRVHDLGRRQSVAIDALLVAAGCTAIVFSLLIVPTLAIDDAALPSRISVAVYPLISMLLLVGSARFAFDRRQRSEAFTLLVAGAACLAVGDVLFALGETGSIDVARNVMDVPYLGFGAFVSVAALHPDTHRPTIEHSTVDPQFGLGRLIPVSFAFWAPTVAALAPATGTARTTQILLCVAVTFIAIWRLVLVSRSEAELRGELIRRARHDDLTGLPSRPAVVDHMAGVLRQQGDAATTLMFIDLDGFKLVNDSLGHAAGDHLLMMVAQRIVDTIRAQDVVGRIGGDEFVVVCADLSLDGAVALADRIRRALRQPFALGGNEVFVGASIGLTMAGADGDAETLMSEADTAMYRSKEAGRDRTTVFDAPMRDRVERRIGLEADLRHAVANDEISVVFQPIVDLVDNHIHGFEALMRWKNASPDEASDDFIGIAEETGLLLPLGSYVLDEACRHLAEWRRVFDADLVVSVNVAITQLQTTGFADEVIDCLARHDLPGSALSLELTERVLFHENVATASAVARLQDAGVQLSVDDFGTGFSSLTYLRRFPVAAIKIDRSFIAEVEHDPAAVSLVASIVQLGHNLRLDVVAEGVETGAQEQLLVELGCDLAQGFRYAPGVPADQVAELLSRPPARAAATPT